jgi:hypothetical protein
MAKRWMKDLKEALAEDRETSVAIVGVKEQTTEADEESEEPDVRSQVGGVAILAGHKAERYRRIGSSLGDFKAEALELTAQIAAQPEAVQISCGEVIREGRSFPLGLRDTLGFPTAVSADASEHRSRLAADAGVLEMAVDASMTIEAQNSLEKMAAHQLAVAHKMAMHFAALAMDEKKLDLAIKYQKASSGSMRSYQQGVDCFHKGRRGGRQIVTVQRVNVNEGGQAIVAGNMNAPSK